MAYRIQRVKAEAQKSQFIQFPWKIYHRDPFWVPPLISERKRFFDPKINPFFKHSDVDLFLVLDNSREPVGRIALILDHAFNEHHSERIGLFGFFECINEQKVANDLFDSALKWCKEKNLKTLRGPFNFSLNHEWGLLVEGFDSPPMIGIPYNPPYYPRLLTKWGFQKAKDLFCFKMVPEILPDHLAQLAPKVGKRACFNIRSLREHQLDEDVKILWDIYSSAFGGHWGFSPPTLKEFQFIAEGLKYIFYPELCRIAFVNNEPVGFSLVLPNINQVLKSLNGKLLPFGWLKFIYNKRKINTYRWTIWCIKSQYRSRGISVQFLVETHRLLQKLKAEFVELSWILEDNDPSIALAYHIGGQPYKRHRIYEKTL